MTGGRDAAHGAERYLLDARNGGINRLENDSGLACRALGRQGKDAGK